MQDRPACLHCHHVPSDPCSLMSASACTVRLAQPCKNPKAPAKRLKQGQKTSAIQVRSNCFQPSQEDCRFHNPSASAGAGASPVCLGFCSKKLRSTLSRFIHAKSHKGNSRRDPFHNHDTVRISAWAKLQCLYSTLTRDRCNQSQTAFAAKEHLLLHLCIRLHAGSGE